MKSYQIPVHERIMLMAFQTVLPDKTVYIGLTITPDMTQLSETGQQILNTIAAYSEGKNVVLFQVSQPKNALKRFRAALGQLEDGDAIMVMATRDGLSGPIIKAINIQKEQADVTARYRIPEDWSLIQAVEEDPPSDEKH